MDDVGILLGGIVEGDISTIEGADVAIATVVEQREELLGEVRATEGIHPEGLREVGEDRLHAGDFAYIGIILWLGGVLDHVEVATHSLSL